MTMIPVYQATIRVGSLPWDKIEVGQCFVVPLAQVKMQSLYMKSWIMGKRLNRRFSIKNHGPEIGVEVSRIE